MIEKEKLRGIMQKRLSEERYYHSCMTAEQCKKLAMQYGEDSEKAEMVGLAHDVAKEWDKETSFAYVKQHEIEMDEVEKQCPKLLHSKIGADICKQEFGFTSVMCQAVEAHTTGKPNMSVLSKILFLADVMGEDRMQEQKDVLYVRELAFRDLNQAVLYVLDYTIQDKITKREMIHLDSILTRNALLMEKM